MNKINDTSESKMITVYSYHPTLFYFFEAFQYRWEIGTGLPADSTDVEPPETIKEGNLAVYNPETDKWSSKVNLYGQNSYSKEDRSLKVIDYIGPVEDGYTLLVPDNEFVVWREDKWVDERSEIEIDEWKSTQLKNLSRIQFLLMLVEYGYDEQVDSVLNSFEDEKERKVIKINYNNLSFFSRTGATASKLFAGFNVDTKTANDMWGWALNQ